MTKEKEYNQVMEILREVYKGESFWIDDRLINETIKALKQSENVVLDGISVSINFEATNLYNKSSHFKNARETNGYRKALLDLEKLGVVSLGLEED